MRYLRFVITAALVAAAGIKTAVADPSQDLAHPRLPLGNNPYPVIWGGQPPRPASPAVPPPAGRPVGGRDHDRLRHDGVQTYYFFGGGTPYVGGPYGYSVYYGGNPALYGWPPYYDSYSYYSYLPPLYLPPDELFGPRAMQRFLGVDGQAGPAPNVILPPRDQSEPPEPKKASQRRTNTQSVAQGWRHIHLGDARFAEQKYAEANQRYRTASGSAPQLADAWFRQGLALLALGRYDQAVAAIKRGLKINPNWARSDFNLKELYGADPAAKNAHRDALAEAAEANPNDADPLFLLGVHLHFDGQAARARKFFDRAKELAPDDSEHIRTFTPGEGLQ